MHDAPAWHAVPAAAQGRTVLLPASVQLPGPETRKGPMARTLRIHGRARNDLGLVAAMLAVGGKGNGAG